MLQCAFRLADPFHDHSTHQLARELRMRLLSFGFCVLQGSQLESSVEFNLRARLYDAALSWFAIPAGRVVSPSPHPSPLTRPPATAGRTAVISFSSEPICKPLRSFTLPSNRMFPPTARSSRPLVRERSQVRTISLIGVISSAHHSLIGRLSTRGASALQTNRAHLLSALLDNEADRIKLWMNPMMDPKRGPVATRPSISEVSLRAEVSSLF